MKGSQVLKIEKNPDLHRATKVSCPKMPFSMNFILGNAGEEKRGGISCECLHFHKHYYKVLKS
jgi:hypothetical protein